MIPKYSANGKKPTWYGVAIDNGYETETLFNSYALAACQKFIRRAQRLFNESLFISAWVRDDDGLAWVIKDLEHRAEV
jgi:hypothetical protein